jgi:uncharacterized protein
MNAMRVSCRLIVILMLAAMPVLWGCSPEPVESPTPETPVPEAAAPEAAAAVTVEEDPAPWKAFQTVMVPMTDGTRLATDVYLPEPFDTARPAILARSVYGRINTGDAAKFNDAGYAYVLQDTRGRGDSEGTDDCMQADGWQPGLTDGADTVAWIIAQPWCNGKVATNGGSALAMTQMLMAPSTDQVAFQFMDAVPASFYNGVAYQGGVFRKSMCEGWLSMQKIGHVIDLWQSHPSYDAFWQGFDAVPKAPETTVPAVMVGGWFDIFQQGTIDLFTSRQENGGEGARGNQKLIMKWSGHGPDHGDHKLGDLGLDPNRFDVKVSQVRNGGFARWLVGPDAPGAAGYDATPAVQYYVMGSDEEGAPGMEWRSADQWPPVAATETPYYLHDGGLLAQEPPATAADMTFTFDPADPFPTHGGQNLIIPYGPFDQRTVSEGRSDFLAFTTEPLAEPVEVTGRVKVRLFVSTDAPDTDFTAKLLDIYPEGDGREILVLDNIRRVKYRDGYEAPAPLLISGEDVVELEIDLWSISWIFNTGHRIGLHISSSNHPRFEANPNTGDDHPGEGVTPRTARNTVRISPGHPSALVLPVVPEGM